MRMLLSFCCLLFSLSLFGQQKSPDELFGDLFVEVQKAQLFKDYKTFVDCIPKYTSKEIIQAYKEQRFKSGFDLRSFVSNNFQLPDTNYILYKSDTSVSIEKHIDSLWQVLTRKADPVSTASSLIPLPHPYVIPGGRFREVFYWDSYFIMLGLQVSGKDSLIANMVDNFSYLIDSLGFIPNGNRTYFLSRSQPPFYALMVNLLAAKDSNLLVKYLPFLEKEYLFWMQGRELLNQNGGAYKRVVKMKGGEILNRYWDEKSTPRPEAYGKEIAYSKNLDNANAQAMYKNIRAACESGWDFSSRWFADTATIQTIHTLDIVPVDLNCLLYFLEKTIAKAHFVNGNKHTAATYLVLARLRKEAILKYHWDVKRSFFMDYDFKKRKNTPAFTLAGCFPLFLQIANNQQAQAVSVKLKSSFLKSGGFLSTLHRSDFQWDSPNGWAPLQWITVKGLLNYGQFELAYTGAKRWTSLNYNTYKRTGKLLEKYNVVEDNIETGGGEYPLQDGFGWTNGVYLKMIEELKGEKRP